MRDYLGATERVAVESPATDQKRCILVLGMHRSGTSASARLLSLLGAALPKHVMAAGASNETGHWEPEQLVGAHDRMLAELGSRWDDWRKLDLGRMSDSRQAATREEIARLIEAEYGIAPLLVLKDPRICRFVPFYEELLGRLGVEPCCVMPMRNPLAVIASLKARDGMTEGFAGLLWLRHVLDAELNTRGWPRAVFSYDALLQDWREVVQTIALRLGCAWPRPLDEAARDVQSFLSTGHRHHAHSRDELAARTDIAEWIRATYGALLRLEHNPNDEAALSQLDRIRAEFDAVCPTFGAATFAELAARDACIVAERQRVDGVRAELASLSATFDEKTTQLAEARDRITALEKSVAEAEHRAAQLGTMLGERTTQLAEARDRIAALEKSVAEAEHRAAELGTTPGELRRAFQESQAAFVSIRRRPLKNLRRFLRWRLTRALLAFEPMLGRSISTRIRRVHERDAPSPTDVHR